MSDIICTDLPPSDDAWLKNESSTWPKTSYEDLVDYLIKSKAYDGKEMRAFRALYAYNYVQNGWLGDINHIKVDSVTYVKASVSPSQPGVGKSDYYPWVAFEEDGHIITASCTCPAGLGRACSHISAIVYAISLAWTHGLAGQTCTDKAVVWGKGSAKSLQPDKISNIEFSKPKKEGVPTVLPESITMNSKEQLDENSTFENHDSLKTFVTQCSVAELWNCPGTMLFRVLNAPESTRNITNTIPFHGSHEMDFSKPITEPTCDLCKNFYNKYVKLPESAYETLAQKTVEQANGSNSAMWHDSRKLRIPSSKLAAVPKTKRADPQKFVQSHLYPRFKGSVATKYGSECESNARTDFESEYLHGQQVKLSGTIVSRDEPYSRAVQLEL